MTKQLLSRRDFSARLAALLPALGIAGTGRRALARAITSEEIAAAA
jgi:hypothetical protein